MRIIIKLFSIKNILSFSFLQILPVFTSFSAQSMEFTSFLKITEDEYVMCAVPMMKLVNMERPGESWERVVRQNWKKESVRENFKKIFCNAQPKANLGTDFFVVNRFVADMVPLMMQFNKQGLSKKDCEGIARLLWQNDAEFREEYQKYFTHLLELFEAIKDNNISSITKCISREICNSGLFTTLELYHCIKATMELYNNNELHHDNVDEILKTLISLENKDYFIWEGHPDFKGKRTSLMLQAIKEDNIPMMRLLASHGADVNNGYWGVKPLMYAVINGKIELVKELTTYSGLDIDDENNSESETALCRATHRIRKAKWFFQEEGIDKLYYEIVRVLLDAGADPEHADCKGRTSLDIANGIVAIQIGKPCSEIYTMSHSYMRQLLGDAGSDPELADIVDLIKQALYKKHPLLNANPDVNLVLEDADETKKILDDKFKISIFVGFLIIGSAAYNIFGH